MEKRTSHYSDVRLRIQDADLLLFRPRGPLWRAIGVAGRSEYSHAAMAGWWLDRLMCVDMTAGGGRAQLLSNLVARWPGVIDVFWWDTRTIVAKRDPEEPQWQQPFLAKELRYTAIRAMISMTGKQYGWLNLCRAAFYHLPFVRFMVHPDTEDGERSMWPPFCSQACSSAYRAAGPDCDPVPLLADRLTEPGDLARSGMFQYQFTLV